MDMLGILRTQIGSEIGNWVAYGFMAVALPFDCICKKVRCRLCDRPPGGLGLIGQSHDGRVSGIR
jgi:hypothetical protein